jgi:hypothetical protein
MEQFNYYKLEESFARLERAAAKGNEESIWITSVVKDVEMEKDVLKEAFAKTEEPLGWCFAGKFSGRREAFDFYKKSAEGGCSWGQVGYGWWLKNGGFVERDEKAYLKWLEKAANQNNPWAMEWLGNWYRREGGDDKEEKAVSFYRAGAELGWKDSMYNLAATLKNGVGCAKDLRQAVIWGAKGDSHVFWELLMDAKGALESRTTENLGCDFNQLCYLLGWGLYWYQYGSKDWNDQSDNDAFSNPSLDYYCSCVELQQKSIVTFLLCWKQSMGVKDVGTMIGKMVWEGRGNDLVKMFEESGGEEPEIK